jgi:hypothetical protein
MRYVLQTFLIQKKHVRIDSTGNIFCNISGQPRTLLQLNLVEILTIKLVSNLIHYLNNPKISTLIRYFHFFPQVAVAQSV